MINIQVINIIYHSEKCLYIFLKSKLKIINKEFLSKNVKILIYKICSKLFVNCEVNDIYLY